MINVHSAQAQHKSQAGFSLTELSIVLAVVGVLFSGVWLAVTRAWNSSAREQAKQDISLTVDGVRGFYSSQAGVPNDTPGNITNALIAGNAIPAPLVRPAKCGANLCADQPWSSKIAGATAPSGTYLVCNSTPGAASACTATGISSFFGIQLIGMDQGECFALVDAISSSSGPRGLVGVDINGIMTTPNINDATLRANCAKAANGSVEIAFVYGIQPPAF